MNPAGFIVLYICLWWILFYMALPIGRARDFEVNEVGAPRRPRLISKMLWVTVVTTVLMGLFVLFDLSTYLDRFVNGEL